MFEMDKTELIQKIAEVRIGAFESRILNATSNKNCALERMGLDNATKKIELAIDIEDLQVADF